MALTENNRQYYEGAQTFRGDGVNTSFTATFDTGLIYYSLDPTNDNYALNNFKVYVSPSGLSGTYVEQTNVEITSVVNNVIEFATAPADGNYIVIQLKTLDGGKYGNNVNDKAYGTTVENNYGSYQYITKSPLTQPDQHNPVYYFSSTQNEIDVNLLNPVLNIYPTPSTVNAEVLLGPKDVIWNYTIGSLGQYEYAANGSVDFDLSTSEQNEVILRILAYAGIVIKDPQVIQAASQQIAAETANEKA